MGAKKYIAFITDGEERSASAANNVVELESHDQILVSSECSCTNSDHMNNCEIVYADLGIKNKNNREENYIVEMAFCKECSAYYIPRKSFNYIRKKGPINHEIKGGVILYELISSGPEFQEEQKQLQIIRRGLEAQLGQIPKPKSFVDMKYESETSIYSFQTLKFENEDIQRKKREIEFQLRSPYHGRIDIGDPDNPTTYYIGGVEDKKIAGVYIHSSWSEIGKLYNDTDSPNGHIYNRPCKVSLRRRIRIVKSELQSIENTFSSNTIYAEKGIYDKFLIEVLMSRKKSHQLTDIIATIQKQQNRIIEKAYAANIIVQGCAGSGKTMVLLHRLSYWLYNNKSLRPEKIKIITPSENFNMHINELHSQLKLDEIEVFSVAQYYCFLLEKYNKDIASVSKVTDEENVEERFVNYIYSKQFLKQFKSHYKEVIDKYSSPEIIEFVAGCAKKFTEETRRPTKEKNQKVTREIFKFDVEKYTSDGELLVDLSSKIQSMSSKDETAKAQNVRIQNKINENIEINSLNSDEKEQILGRVNRYKADYKKELALLISNRKNELNELVDEYNKMISEINNTKKDGLNYYYEQKIACLEEKLEYEDLLSVINNSESIDALSTIMDSEKIKSPILVKYIGEYKKQKNLYYDINSLMKKNEQDNIEAEKKTVKTYLTDEESDRLKDLIEKYPSNISLFLFNKVFDMTIAEKLRELDIDRPKDTYRFELYARLVFAGLFWNKTVGEDEIICIDEGQDVSYNEYELIYDQNKKNHAYYSVFGDLNQRIKQGRGLTTWEQLKQKLIATEYELNENYRNTNQVTEYCNDAFGFNMILTGVDGDPVRHITFDEMLDEIKMNSESDGVTAVLLPRSVSKQRITRSNKFKDLKNKDEILSTKYDTTKISIMYVDEIKGIEFNKVYVMEEGMEKNEKYIAYTRSLDKLIVVH